MIEIPMDKEKFKIALFHILGLFVFLLPMLIELDIVTFVIGLVIFIFYHGIFIGWHAMDYGGINYLKKAYVIPKLFKFRGDKD